MSTGFTGLQNTGLVKFLGVFNFNHGQLELVLNKAALKYKPVSNQENFASLFTSDQNAISNAKY